MEKVKLGKYQHFKGGLYRVIAVGKIEATGEDVVVYETLYDNPVSRVWVRPLNNFLETVEIDGKKVPRFEYIGDK
jgi:hypothetical protein